MTFLTLSARQTNVTGQSIEALIDATDFASLSQLRLFEIRLDENQENANIQNRLAKICCQLRNL